MFGFKDFFRNVFLTLSQNVSSHSWQMEVDMKVYFLPVSSFSDESPFMFEKPQRAAQSNYLFLSSVHFLETSQVYFLCILMPLQVCPTTTPHTHMNSWTHSNNFTHTWTHSNNFTPILLSFLVCCLLLCSMRPGKKTTITIKQQQQQQKLISRLALKFSYLGAIGC